MRARLACFALAIAAAATPAAPALAQGATPAGSTVRNVAQVEYRLGANPRQVASNEVTLRVEQPASRASIAIARLTRDAAPAEGFVSTAGPTACLLGGTPVPLSPPVDAAGNAVDPLQPQQLAGTSSVHAGEALLVRVADADQNRDAARIDTVEVRVTSDDTADSERLQLSETGVNTGVFVGYVPSRSGSGVAGSCALELRRDSRMAVEYVDSIDAADFARAAALVDPSGLVFDSLTGRPVNGARIRLIDVATGRPASVRGDDGRSAHPAEMITGAPATDSGGTLYQYPAGRFRFPLVQPGTYRLVIEPPSGYLFASDASNDVLQRLPGAPFRLGDGSFGRDFVVTGPLPTLVDVPLDPAAEGLVVRKSASAAEASVGDFLAYEIVVQNPGRGGVARGVELIDLLPRGLRIRAASLRVDGQPRTLPPLDASGTALRLSLPQLASGRSVAVRYVAEVTAAAAGDELVNVAYAVAEGGLRSADARARVGLEQALFDDAAILVGRVQLGACDAADTATEPAAGVRVYLENGRYALTDSDGRYHFEGVRPGTHVVQLDPETLPPGASPLVCETQARHAGRGASQFLELRAGALWRADFRLRPGPESGSLGTTNVQPAANARALTTRSPEAGAGNTAGTAETFDIEALEPGVRFLAPLEAANPAIASIKIAIAHAPGQSVDLRVNGARVSELNFDGTARNAARTMSISRWRGVDLVDGANELEARVGPAAPGAVAIVLRRTVHYGGGAVRAQVDRERSVLLADGRTRPVVAVRLFDAYGKPARTGTLGAFRVGAPYRTWAEVEALNDNPLLATGTREPTFEVDADGIARLELEPTTQSGNALVQLRFNERQSQDLRVWLEPQARDWILVALASGSVARQRVEQAAEALATTVDAPRDEVTTDGRVALFAKGRVRGDALLTIAFDSERDPRAVRARSAGLIEPDEYYLLYGDGTEPREEAATSKRLFLKLERRQFVLLFGDFDSGLTVTELARYSRTLTGLKTEYWAERAGISAFAARTDLGFGRDELRGDGTSGLYRLARRGLVVGSDKLRLEVRDRFRTERVLSARELTRFLDYSLDYDAGTVLFRQPVPSRDEALNPIFIIAEYETRGRGEEVTAAGGRASLRLHDGALELGASALHDGGLLGASRLGGVDLRWQIDPVTLLRAEAAYSESDDPTRAASAAAWLAEWERVTQRFEARVYAREQQSGFGVGQQLTSEAGTRKFGGDARWNLGPLWAMQGELQRQEALDTGASRTLAAGELRYTRDLGSAAVGLRHVEDDLPGGLTRRSELASLTASRDLAGRSVTLRGTLDTALGGRDESADYPSRLLLGADWRVRDWATLFAEWEHADGSAIRADTSRVGVRATPGERTQIFSALNRRAGEFGPRTFANLGLTQGFRLDERWTLDVGLDHSRTVAGSDGAPPQPLLTPTTPLASGNPVEDFTAAFVGAQYHATDWTLTARAERRIADLERRWVLTGGWYREPARGHALSLSIQGLASDAAGEAPDLNGNELRFSWAYRPDDARWIVLARSDLLDESRRDPRLKADSLRWVQNLHANWQRDARQQLGLQLGFRRVISQFDEQRFRGNTLLLGADWRRELPLRLAGRALDAGAHGSWLESLDAGVGRHQLGLDLGVTVATNVWVSLGYNFRGYRDDDFSRARQTVRGPYLQFRVKLDQDNFKDLRLDSLRPPR